MTTTTAGREQAVPRRLGRPERLGPHDQQTVLPRQAVPEPARRTRRTPVVVIGAMLLAMAAELPLLRVFGPAGLRLVLLAVPAAALASAGTRAWLSRLSRGPRSPLPAVAGFAAGLAAGALPGMLLAAPDPFGPATLGPRLQQALTDGWYRLLSVPVPVPYTRSFTDLPFLIAAALAALIMMVALGGHPAVAVLIATLGFGGSLVLGVGGPMAGTVLAAVYALAVLIFLASVSPRTGYRAAAAAVLPGTVVVAVTVLAVGAIHPGRPYNPRAALRAPLNVTVSQDPLALLSARLETPGTRVLTAQLSGSLLTQPPYWVVLTYESYDGADWLATGAARTAVTGGRAPGTNGTGSAHVTMAQPTALLPHPAYVLDTDGENLGYDPGTEMLASPSAIRDYSISVSVPEPDQADLATAALPSDSPMALTQSPSCTPAALESLADEVRTEVSAPYEQATRLQRLLSSAPFRYNQSAPPGEGCASINNMLASRKGTSAQFATAFVLAARLLAIPARIAVGYLPGRLAGDTETVTDAAAYAWPQVELAGIGWVNFDPTPKGGSAGLTPTQQKQPDSQKPPVKEPRSSPVGNSALVPPPKPRPGMRVMERVLLLVATAMMLVLAWAIAVRLWSRRRQHRRRRAAEPAVRVLGAWHEILIPLGQAGMPVRGRSAPSVAADAAAIVPHEAHSVGQLATLAERALYDQIGEHDADLAWRLSDRVRGPAAAAASSRARLRRVFVPTRASG